MHKLALFTLGSTMLISSITVIAQATTSDHVQQLNPQIDSFYQAQAVFNGGFPGNSTYTNKDCNFGNCLPSDNPGFQTGNPPGGRQPTSVNISIPLEPTKPKQEIRPATATSTPIPYPGSNSTNRYRIRTGKSKI
jgi:hypothetical protein